MRFVSFLLAGLCLQTAVSQTPKRDPSAEADALVRQGAAEQQHGDLIAAIDDFRKAVAVQPALAKAHASLGAALAAAGQFDEAIEEDARALAGAPQDTAVRMNLAMAYYRKGDLKHACTELESIRAAHPSDISAAIMLGYTYNKLGRESEAAGMLAPLEAGHEDNTELEYALAYALIQSGRQADGISRMEKLARTKRSAEAWLIAGSARFYRGEMKIARADLDAAVELNPSLPGLYTMAGQARYAMKDMDAAAAAFQAALRADAMDFIANRDLGAMRLKEGDSENAKPLLELALQLHPTDPLTRLEMAKLDELTGKYAEAAAILEDLVRTDPKWLDPHWLLASVYTELNRPEDGRRERGIVQQIEAWQQKEGPPEK
jgi:tetratricopeptide (TPR) repeat protein